MMTIVCLSVCHVRDSNSRTEEHKKLKFDNRDAQDMGDLWSHLEVKGQGHKAVQFKIMAQLLAT